MADINVTEEIIDINVTEEVVNIIAPLGGYPLPNTINSVFGRVGNIVATEGDYTLTQLGDVTLTSPANGQVLKYNGTTWVNDSDSGITGTGTTNTLPKFTGASTIGNSNVSDSGTLITLGSNTTISSGGLGIGTTNLTGITFNIGKTITGATTAFAVLNNGQIQSDVTGARYFNTSASTATGTAITGGLNHYLASQGTILGSVNDQTGFNVNASLIGATTNYGFRGQIPSGANRWNIYMDGTANNYLAGSLGIGSTSLTDTTLNIAKNITGAATYFVVRQSGVVQSDANTNILAFNNQLNTQATSFVLTQYIHYNATQGTIGAGSSVGTNTGFNVSPSMIGGTNNYGFRSGIPVGAGRWNLFIDGTAANFLAGDTGIGTQSLGTATMLTIGGTETAVSAISRGQLINTTLVASANNDALVALDITPTFTNGAFTGVRNIALRSSGDIQVANNANINGLKTNGQPFVLVKMDSTDSVVVGNNQSATQLLGVGIEFRTGAGLGAKLFNTNNLVIQNAGTYVDAGFRLDVNGTTRLNGSTTITGSTTATSGIGRGELNSATLVASANSDNLIGLDIAPAYTNGAFTGVNNIGLRLINTLNATGADVIRASPLLQLSGSIWNSGLGAVRILGGLEITAFQQNSNPTISKLSFLVGTDNALATEQMFITSAGLLGINGGANFNAGTGSFLNDITIAQTAAATSSVAINSNRLILKGRAWNSAQGNASTMGYLQMISVVNNANPTTDKLSFFVGSANTTNNGNVVGNATERLAIRTDGIFSYFNLAGTEFLRLVGSTGNVLINTTTDIASSKLTVNSTTQGFLPPRMTTTEKNAISSPATGLVVFDTTLGKLCVFAGTWQTITSA